jgi:hypothetical protein
MKLRTADSRGVKGNVPSSRRHGAQDESIAVAGGDKCRLTRRSHMAMSSVMRRDHSEGQVARAIEEHTAKLPSDLFLWAAIGSMAASATFQLAGNRQTNVFIGQWAPTFLILGVYNKLVKQMGSDGAQHAR